MITAADRKARLAIARKIHDGSRHFGPFVTVSGRRVVEDAKGMEDAWRRALSSARRGTIFLDCDDAAAVPLLAHVSRTRTRVSRTTPRLVVGTGIDLYAYVKKGTLPDELFYRLNTIHIE